MKSIISFFLKVLVYADQKKQEYVFKKSLKYVDSWGEKTYGQPEIVCYDGKSVLSVGRYTSIASNVSILLGANHKRGLITTYPRSLINKNVSQEETNERGDVVVGNDVWIGYGATIIGPATIGDGAIIGASALVIGDVPPYAVVGGVPAKVLKYRFQEGEIQKLLSVKWWEKNEKEIKDLENFLYSRDVDGFLGNFHSVTVDSSFK
jgi:acetyltransferase-like isoleucine patch superfamily enzyme